VVLLFWGSIGLGEAAEEKKGEARLGIGGVLGREQGLQSGEVGRNSAGWSGIGLGEAAEGKGEGWMGSG